MGNIINRYLPDVNWQQGKPELTGGEVHIWRISISKAQKRIEEFKALLNTDESLRAGRYKQQKDTYRFIISRGVQRILLGSYLNRPPAGLQFVLGENKKPHLVSREGNIIHYNLSHSGDWILMAVATLPVGADVEYVDDAFPYHDILPDNFSPDEIAYIGQGNPARFFTLWTRKEAILKATGQGLGEHLAVTPSLNGEYPLPKGLSGADENWQLNTFPVHDNYTGSVAVANAGQSYSFFDIGPELI
ncbi:4'-phosphopantetheinyl transferase superfamily protein [Mucilaginibacter sp. 14171R-50]|uniref:4'-phosphopantetheinyl transferase family protein n=1 Tax=Mucilaginibacter sp. 14171R-50 TaxID=2703789 RepID=UPI00138B24BD|nr:4'-phosphopantetheinyl transferase superfamily protein [Mucilaginibacter sp. 14171R-50]QHS56283.1 4'-phosphopantetheinyl transferase superfamily protein [Mucilaginibacter sp. 14171R-50]